MPLPQTVKIGPIDYKIVVEAGLHDASGLLDGRHKPSDCTLALRAELENNRYKAVVLLHEIIHAQIEVSALRLPDDLVEPTCDALAYGLLGLLRDNPKLVQYLLE